MTSVTNNIKKLDQVVSVTDFGADPSGLVDSSPAFTAAILALPSTGGDILVPSGRYLMNSGVTLNKAVTLRGTGTSTVNNEIGGTTVFKSATVTTPIFTLTGNSSSIRNMVIQGVTGNSGDGVLVLAGRCTLEDLCVYNMGNDGVRIGSDSGVNANLWLIKNLKSKNNINNGLTISDKVSPAGADANGGSLFHADLQSNGAAGCELINAQLNTFVGLVCQTNGGRGLSLKIGADKNTFIGGDFEACGADEVGIEAGATSNVFIGLHVAGSMTDNGNNTLIFGATDTQFVTGIKVGNFGSTDLKVLDWYEEGSWTPTLTFATPGDLSVAYSAQVGKFTRIGNLVTVNCTIVTTTFTHTTASGQLRVSGLPYTSESVTNGLSIGALQHQGLTYTPAMTQVCARVDSSTTNVGFFASSPGQTIVNSSTSSTVSGSNITLVFSLTYRSV